MWASAGASRIDVTSIRLSATSDVWAVPKSSMAVQTPSRPSSSKNRLVVAASLSTSDSGTWMQRRSGARPDC